VRHAGVEAWLRNRPWRMAGLFAGFAVLVLAVAFGVAAVLA
jgi:threonine/homoserine/homoserine lactone efflux protein